MPAVRPAAARMALFYAAFFVGWGCVLPYWPVWYAERGLSPEAIGVAAGVGLAARMLISPAAAFWSDGLRRAKDPLIALSWLTFVFWLAHIPAREPWMLVTLAFLTGAALYPIIPLSDSLAVREARRGGFAYGPVRAVGSASFIVANLGSGALIGWLGGEAMLGWMIAATLLMALAAYALPAGERIGEAEALRVRLRGLGGMIARPDFLLALVATALVTSSHAFYYVFSALAWSDQGLESVWVGVLWAVAVAAEIAFFAVSARLGARLSPVMLIFAGAAAGAVRWLLLALDPPLVALFVLQPLHGLSFGAVYLGFVQVVERIAGERRMASALALNSAVSGGALSALLTAASGWLYAHQGISGFAWMAVPAALGGLAAMALGFVLRRRPPEPVQPHKAGEGMPIDAPL